MSLVDAFTLCFLLTSSFFSCVLPFSAQTVSKGSVGDWGCGVVGDVNARGIGGGQGVRPVWHPRPKVGRSRAVAAKEEDQMQDSGWALV